MTSKSKKGPIELKFSQEVGVGVGVAQTQNNSHSTFRKACVQSSGSFDMEAHLELKTPPDPSEISIRRIFRKHRISIRTKLILRSFIKKFLEMVRTLQLFIRNDILLTRRRKSDLPDDGGRTH